MFFMQRRYLLCHAGATLAGDNVAFSAFVMIFNRLNGIKASSDFIDNNFKKGVSYVCI